MTRPGSSADATRAPLATSNTLGQQNKDEERIRRRRLDEEEARLLRVERTEQRHVEQERVRETIPRPRGQTQRDLPRGHRPPQAQVDLVAAERPILNRTLSAFDRSAELLLRGQGNEARIVLSLEGARAKDASREHGHGSHESRLLGALGANMTARAEALGATHPKQAEKWASRLDRIAAATEQRAAALEAAGRPLDARLLGSIAIDSRAQAALFGAAAANLDALLAHSLLRALHRLADVSMTGILRRDSSIDRGALGQAFASLDRTLQNERLGLHQRIDPAHLDDRELSRLAKGAQLAGAARPELALSGLFSHPLIKTLMPHFLDLSRALHSGDVSAANDARGAIARQLQQEGVLPALKELLAQQKAPPVAHVPAEIFAQRTLPLMILRGVAEDKLGTLANPASPQGVNALLKKVDTPETPLDQLSPAERILGHAIPARTSETPLGTGEGRRLERAWGPAALGSYDALLPGTHSLLHASGLVTQQLRAQPLHLSAHAAPLAFAADPASLPAVAPHELAVFAGENGGVIVRSGAGSEVHQGFLTGADGSRVYFDAHGVQGFQRVLFQPAGVPQELLMRLDLEVDASAGRGVDEIEEDAPEKRRFLLRRASAELAALVIDCPGELHGTFLGVLPRAAAEAFAFELEAASQNRRGAIEARFVERATDCASELAHLGAARANVLQLALADHLVELGFTPRDVAALVLITDDATAAGLVSEGGLTQPAFVPLDGGPVNFPKVGADRLRDPALAREGVLLLPLEDFVIVD